MNVNKSQYGIYVTPKTFNTKKSFYDKKAKWGGYHITLGSFQSKAGRKKLKRAIGDIAHNILKKAPGSQWTPQMLKIAKKKQGQTLVIGESKTLRKISEQLQSKGIKKIIGSKSKKKGNFHITLPDAKNKKEAKKIKKKFSQKGRQWQLTLVKTKPPVINNCKWIAHWNLGVI